MLAIEGLSVTFPSPRGRFKVIEDVGFKIGPGETLGVVGESGSGKSMTALAAMRLLPEGGAIGSGTVRLDGVDLVAKPAGEMRTVRGRALSMIFQEPMRSLNPLLRAGFQIGEALEAHLGMSRAEARAKAIELLRLVGFPSPELQVDRYPHELSGGMRQRVMIAMALALEPKVVIADEPTTALDVTIQAQVLRLLQRLGRERKMGMLLITHDLGVVARMATRVVIMYAGQIVEEADTRRIFSGARHPYTQLLLRAMPRVSAKLDRLQQISGTAPLATAWPAGCRFQSRCPVATAVCRTDVPPLVPTADGGRVRCWHANKGEFVQ